MAAKNANGTSSGGKNFNIAQSEMCQIMKDRTGEGLSALNESYGGVSGLAKRLQVDALRGLPGDESDAQKRIEDFGKNFIPPKKPKSFFQLMWEAIQDLTLIVLIGASVISVLLALLKITGVIPSPEGEESADSAEEHNIEWVEGVAIMVAIAIVVLVTAFNDWSKERQFRGLQERICEEQRVDVLRSGEITSINVAELLVGDVVHVKYGDQIPADGVLIQCNDLKVDESSMTGESDLIKKSADQVPWMLAGTHVMEGGGRMLVVAVGISSQTGIILSLLGATANKAENMPETDGDAAGAHKENGVRVEIANPSAAKSGKGVAETDVDAPIPPDKKEDEEAGGDDGAIIQDKSVLQAKLTKLTFLIGKAGTLAAVLTVVVLFARFVISEIMAGRPPSLDWLNQFISDFVIGITVLVVAVPEGLPLAVTISLAYSVKKMMKDNNLVRHLDACETMGSATTICSDKTGTLTKNRMTVTQIYAQETHYTSVKEFKPNDKYLSILSDAVAINSGYTSQIIPPESGEGQPKHLGNKTECGLLGLLVALGADYHQIREQHPEDSFLKVYTFNSSRKSMTTVVALPNGGKRIYTKGASEAILKKCTGLLNSEGDRVAITKKQVDTILKTVVEPMAGDALRTICIAYRDLEPDEKHDFEDEVATLSNLTCIAITGIEDPVRDEVPGAIKTCQEAGITVRMVTGDNLATARAIAFKCGIITPQDGFLVIDGKEFNRRIRNKQGLIEQKLLDKVWPNLRVLARSSPTDKHTLVKGIIDSELPNSSEVVAVTGDGTNDGPALKKADVGFAMGIAGTDVAKEASDIILTDDNFISIVKAVMWGRNVYDSIAKFLQFQLTVNFVAIVLAFTSACILQATPLKAIHLLWVNLIMDTFASLALATELPTTDLLKRKPYGRTKPLISTNMAKNVLGHGVYMLAILYFILFAGPLVFKFPYDIANDLTEKKKMVVPSQHYTLIFNVFVIMQCFNEINARKIHGERNVFKGIHTNPLFICIVIGTLIVQGLLVEFGGIVMFTTGLTWQLWLWSMAIGMTPLVWGQVLNTIPADKLPKCLSWGGGADEVASPQPGGAADDQQGTSAPDGTGAAAAGGAGGFGTSPSNPGAGQGLAGLGGENTRSKLLWVRGVTRIQQQIRVVDTWKELNPGSVERRSSYAQGAHNRFTHTSTELFRDIDDDAEESST